MNDRILFVDDEQHVLGSYRRILRKNWDIVTALGGETALDIFDNKGPFAVVVSDMRMPGMNGIQLLTKIKEISPDTVRMMLTGYADFNTAMEAVNEGHIFRFLTKPCPPDLLNRALQEGVRQYRLIKAEQELLNKTLKGTIQVLIEILSVMDPKAFNRANRLRDYIKRLTEQKAIAGNWEIEIAALLSLIGQVTVPGSVMEKVHNNVSLTDVEKAMIMRIPKAGFDLLVKIPRLEQIAKIVLYQNKRFNGEGFPEDDIKGVDLPLGARLLKILNDLIILEDKGILRKDAFVTMAKRTGWYDPNLLLTISNKISGSSENVPAFRKETKKVKISELHSGYLLLENIETSTGQMLMMAGQEISDSHIMRIKNWAKLYTIKEPIKVLQKI